MPALVYKPTFPYMSDDNIIAPYTDGTLDDGHNIIATYLPLCGAATSAQSPRKLSGTVQKGYLGETDMIFADRIQYGQNAGDS
jgi:hypothetical protein